MCLRSGRRQDYRYLTDCLAHADFSAKMSANAAAYRRDSVGNAA